MLFLFLFFLLQQVYDSSFLCCCLKKKKKFGLRLKFHQDFISDSLIPVKRILQQHNFLQPSSLLTDNLSYDISLTSHPNISFTGTFTF